MILCISSHKYLWRSFNVPGKKRLKVTNYLFQPFQARLETIFESFRRYEYPPSSTTKQLRDSSV